jgi:uncharacterized protein YjbJ (UPF0337 family)
MIGAPGTSEVHSELSYDPSKGEEMSGKFGPASGGAGETLRDRADDMLGQARSKVDEATDNIQDRAGDLKDKAKNRVSGVMDRAGSKLDESGVPAKLDRYPLAAFGVAFGVGFLLAGTGNETDRFSRTRRQLRTALVAGATTALTQQAQSAFGMRSGQQGGLGNALSNLFGRDDEQDQEESGRDRGRSRYERDIGYQM